MTNRAPLIRSSALAVQTASIANLVFVAAVLIGLAASVLIPAQFVSLLFGDGTELAARIAGARWMLLLGLAMGAVIHVLLRALGAMIATVVAGDPFVEANAGRLDRIGWALLALQLLDIPATIIGSFHPELGNAAPDVSISPGGWIAVLMVFVLARIFTAGSVMREELEGTI